jgi:hypothetical protein
VPSPTLLAQSECTQRRRQHTFSLFLPTPRSNGLVPQCPFRVRSGHRGGVVVRAAWRCSPRSGALVSIARGVSGVCKGLPETFPATGSNCKSRDYQRVCCPSGSTPRMWGIGSPSTQCQCRYLSPRTKGHRQRHGLAKFQRTSPPQEQRHQTSASQGFSAQRHPPRVSYLSS